MRLAIVATALLASLLAGCGGTSTADRAAATTIATTVAAATTAVPAASTTPGVGTPRTVPAANPAGKVFHIVPSESKVTYEVGETFLNQGNRFAVALGTTQTLSGTVSFDRANPRNSTVGPIEVDISAFQSDSQRRDKAIRERWLESSRFPIATFVPTKIEGLPERYTDGEELTLTITGDLTVRDTTKPVTFSVTGKVDGDEMRGVASTEIAMSDFGFQPPDIAGMLRAEDKVKLTFTFLARP